MAEVHAEVTVNGEAWAATWSTEPHHYTPLYIQSKVAFEAARCAERATA